MFSKFKVTLNLTNLWIFSSTILILFLTKIILFKGTPKEQLDYGSNKKFPMKTPSNLGKKTTVAKCK
jgi:hypothetical protein